MKVFINTILSSWGYFPYLMDSANQYFYLKLMAVQYTESTDSILINFSVEVRSAYQAIHYHTTFIVIIILLIALLILFIILLKRKNSRIRKQESTISELKKERQTLKDVLFSKTRIGEKVKLISLSNPEPHKLIKMIPHLMHESEWSDFTCEFDKVYDDFTIRLSDQYPSIGKEDIQLCCLLKLKRNISDIALFLGIDKKSVNKRKSRLKLEKMELNSSVDFDEFIDRF